MRLISETLNEIHFTRGQEPKTAMGIGTLSDMGRQIKVADVKSGYTLNGYPGSIGRIFSKKSRVCVTFHGWDLKKPNGKMMHKKPYVELLLAQTGLDKFFGSPYIDYEKRNWIWLPVLPEYSDIFPQNTVLAESFNFERGQDPKKSMGIGEEAMYKEIGRMMKSDGWTPSDPWDNDSALGWAVEYGHHELAKFILDRKGTSESNALLDPITWAVQNNDIEMVKLLLSYNPDPHRLEWPLKRAIRNEPIYKLLNNYIENFINESFNFERGQDPKKSMDIGYHNLVKNIDSDDLFLLFNATDLATGELKSMEEFAEEPRYWNTDLNGRLELYNRAKEYYNLLNSHLEWYGMVENMDELEKVIKMGKFSYDFTPEGNSLNVVLSDIELPSAQTATASVEDSVYFQIGMDPEGVIGN